jgi:hypothetical protein
MAPIFTFTRTLSLRDPTSIPKRAGPETFPANRFFRAFVSFLSFFGRFPAGFVLFFFRFLFSASVLFFFSFLKFYILNSFSFK